MEQCQLIMYSQEINHSLISEVAEEVRAAVFQMSPVKAPDPDGFGGIFYQKCWGVVGSSTTQAVKTTFC